MTKRKPQESVKPMEFRRIPNVIGREVDPQTMASALYPYRDYPDTKAELEVLQHERRKAEPQSGHH